MSFLGNVIDVRSVELNTGHRLARDLRCLLVDCGGYYRELVNGEGNVTHSLVGTNPDVANGLLGRCTGFNGSNGCYVFDDVVANVRVSDARAWACGLVKVGTAAEFGRPFGRTANNGGSAPFANFDFEINPASAGQDVVTAVVPNTAFGFEATPGASVLSDNAYITLLGQASAANKVRLFADGALKATSADAPSLVSVDTDAKMIINGYSDAASDGPSGCQVYWAGVWARELSDDEALELNDLMFDDSPSALLRRSVTPVYLFAHAAPAGGSNIPAIMHSYRQRRA